MLSQTVIKSKIGSNGFNLTKKVISLNRNFKPKSNVYSFCKSNFLALIISQPETVKINVTKSYILVDLVGILALV